MHSGTPDLLPILSRGKHRTPRKGACFMELASYLAGERWSDHPKCTHPTLAHLCRAVNDHVGDEVRSRRLAPMVASVIGLTGDDPRVDAWIAQEAALTALTVASPDKQKMAALGLISSERFVGAYEGRARTFAPHIEKALASAPRARDWALAFPATVPGGSGGFGKRSAVTIVQVSVDTIAASTGPARDEVLVDLLERTIERCTVWLGRPGTQVTSAQWREVHALTVR